MDKTDTIFVAGHKGMVGSAICRALIKNGYGNILKRSHAELDLTRQNQVESFFGTERPDYVFLSAAKVGGILANSSYPAEFIYQNIAIQNNVIHSANLFGVKKLLFLGSSCIYPRNCKQPMKEEYLLTNTLEPTNEAYAIAKIAGIKMCQSYFNQFGSNFISVMPTNLYGANDNFDLQSSHVLPAMIRKFHEAKIIWETTAEPNSKPIVTDIWGTGKPKREFLHVADMAEACLFAMNQIDAKALYGMGITHLNVGTGQEISIAELAETVRSIVGFQGDIRFDTTKPDGTSRKLLDVSRMRKLGWQHSIDLKEGITKTYAWYLEHVSSQ
jgi:GDP-L-fucose synthase